MIVSGSTSQALAARLADCLDAELAAVDVHRFPDGELLAGVPGFAGDRAVVVVATTSPRAHLELLQLQDAVREAGAGEVVTVLPYMGYARQDRPAAPDGREATTGYPVSARAMARAVSTGADRVLTVNPHEDDVCEFFDPSAEAVDAAGRLAAGLPGDLTDPLFLAPDRGARDLARAVRDGYGRGAVDGFEKTRLGDDRVELRPRDATVDDRDVVVTDDIVATGSTAGETVSLLTEMGARRTYVACVHPLLAGSALTRLSRAGVAEVVGTDTVERAASAVSAAPAIADRL